MMSKIELGDDVIGDEKYFKLLELGNGKDLPDMINTNTKK